MKLELNVVRFENEDVIATSCHEAMLHANIIKLCDDTGYQHEGNGIITYYYPCDIHEGMYVTETVNEVCEHDLELGWYHVDGERCEGGISAEQVCGEYDDASHDYH